MTFVLHFMVATAVFAALDFVWLGFVANKLYRKLLGGLLREKPLLPAAVLFYLLYILGLVVFTLQPALALREGTVPALNGAALYGALWRGGLFGLVGYATYDLTNLATLKRWSLRITYIDMVWGTALSAAVAGVCYLIFQR
jgi:uncharacterized membrane protein